MFDKFSLWSFEVVIILSILFSFIGGIFLVLLYPWLLLIPGAIMAYGFIRGAYLKLTNQIS